MECAPAPRSDHPVDKVKTSDFYRTCKLPKRFDYPQIFTNYGCHKRPAAHPFYVTTSSDYGFYPPSHHTVPTCFYPRNQAFSGALAKAGMYRNFSLNV
ncbi:UPF0691 protein C9orf116 [Homalodisca vitripennis]|uniref:UPF0691 protein C9orf116 n=1 Tax=Homalodisca vitripennis TaxID=197043 RepID=UPI001EEC03A0|nr:UPF0691 protein C9orf116 [Homalodisca vitripennis]